MTRTEELRDRLLGPPLTDRLWGWLGPGLIALIGGFLRLWHLGTPHSLVFDETYYVKQGWSMFLFGSEMRFDPRFKDNAAADLAWASGETDVFSHTDGDMVVHPPVGKWIIGAGEWLFGAQNSFGWRFSVAVLGTLSILMIGRIARRMFGSTSLGCIAAFLVAFEGFHYTMSRTGILDMIVSFFALAAFGALLLDRWQTREIIAEKVGRRAIGEVPLLGPRLGWRPWRWVAAISLGLCTSTKWSGLFFLAAFGLLTVWWDLGAMRAAGVRHWRRTAILHDGPKAFLVMVGTTLVVYSASWTGWFLGDKGYHRHWDTFHPGEGPQWLPPVLRNWLQYHADAYAFNTTLSTPHPYQSNPWSWLLQLRPTSFYYESPAKGVDGCVWDSCSSAINPIANIAIWWMSIPALLVVLWWWLRRRDWRAGAIVAGMVGGYLPWFAYQHRTIYTFYAVAFEPYVILAVTFLIGLFLRGSLLRAGVAHASLLMEDQRRRRIAWVAAYLVLVVVLFAFFFPVYTAQVTSYDSWHIRMWFPSWV